MAQKYANNAFGTLVGGVTAIATTLVVDAGAAALFPEIGGADYYLATLIALDGEGNESTHEIVKVTAKSGGVLTVVRAQEGTTGAIWGNGSRIELRNTAETMLRFETAYNWGDHGLGGYLTAVAEGDVTAHQAALSIGWGQLTAVPTSFNPSAHTHAKSDIVGFNDADYAPAVHAHDWASITSKPTTLALFGITDGVATSTTPTLTGVVIGTWTISEVGGELIFNNGTKQIKITAAGGIVAEDEVAAGGTI